MKTLFENLKIIPVTKDEEVIEGSILIEDDKIKKIAPKIDHSGVDTIKDCSGLVAIPGLINSHTHLSMTLMRNYKDTCSNLQEWLGEIFPIEDRLDEEDIYWASRLGLAESIKAETTCFADMYFQQWKTVQACKEAGMRAAISLALFGDEEETKKRLSNRKLFDSIDVPTIRADVAVHSIYTCSKGTYSYASSWAKERGLVVNTHLSETKKEVDDCLRETGKTPAFYLDETGFFDLPCYVAHGVWLTDDEVKLLAEKDVSIVHNPSSNCKLASGIAPVSKFQKLGANIALGTDGASSNNNLSMLKEMRLAAMISTVSTMDVSALRPYEILKMATANGAKALHLEDKIGTLEEGKQADIVFINQEVANICPVNDLFSALVFSINESNVDSLYVAGRCLMEKGRLQSLDEEIIYKEVKKRWARLASEE